MALAIRPMWWTNWHTFALQGMAVCVAAGFVLGVVIEAIRMVVNR